MSKFFFLSLLLFIPLFGKEPCPFCDGSVIGKQFVDETETVNVLYPLSPATEGHLLVIPKRHITRFEELSDQEMIEVKGEIEKAASAFQKLFGVQDYLVLQKNGKLAGQSVSHIHFHVIATPVNVHWLAIKAFLYSPSLSDQEMEIRASQFREVFAGNYCD